jgi:PPP family 3-phenylpropionic acid transporter
MNRFFLYICGFYFWFFSLIGVYVIYLPKLLQLEGYTSFSIGIVFAIAPLVRFFVPFLFLNRFVLTKNIYFYALVFLFSGTLFIALSAKIFFLLVISNIIFGIAVSLVLPFVESLALDIIGKERYGKSRLWGSIGFIAIALTMADFVNKKEIILSVFVLTSLFASLFGFAVAKSLNKTEKYNSKEKFNFFAHWKLWVSLFLTQASFGAFYNFFTIYEAQKGLDYRTIGYLWSFGVICEIIIFFLQAPLMKRNLLTILQMTSFLTWTRWLLVHFFGENIYVLYFSQSLHAFGFALYYSSAIAYLYQVYKQKRLAQQFFSGITFGLASVAGSIFAGMVYGDRLFLYSSFLAFFGLIVLLFEKKP